MTFLFNSDLTQYTDNYWPTIDPQRLPGTTVVAGSTARQSQLNGSPIAGGTTLRGFTAAMLHLRPDGRQLDARKSWFLFDNEIIALGSAIQATASDAPVETIVENRLLRNEPAFTRAEDNSWAHLAAPNIGYYFPASKDWKEDRANHTGSWSLINTGGAGTSITRRYHTLWFDHGPSPTDASYVYAILPNSTREQTETYAATPQFTVLENSAAAHAVTETTLGITAVNFWTNSPHTAAGITSDRVASILIEQRQGALDIAIADPTQSNIPIHIELDRPIAAVTEKDERITIDQAEPTLKLTIQPQSARGRALRASFTRP